MNPETLENKIISIYDNLNSFSKATGLSVPVICQVITGKDVLRSEEKSRFDNALNIEVWHDRGKNPRAEGSVRPWNSDKSFT